ncbi:MAG: hypothetical protein ACOYY2_02965 [Actinomycetota bacterium]
MVAALDVDLDPALVESLAPPCELDPRTYHGIHGTGPAAWVLTLRRCCPRVPPHVLACEGCTGYICTSLDRVGCRACGTVYPRVRDMVLAKERL